MGFLDNPRFKTVKLRPNYKELDFKSIDRIKQLANKMEYELIQENKATPLFATQEAYEQWSQKFIESVKPTIEKSRLAMTHSIKYSPSHIVD